jgi:cob(I)alamin adenosyltransferase
LTVYNVEEQDRRLSEIEESILDCTQDLQHLESETLSNTEKNELKKLKSQIDGLKTSKEQLRQQIERQTRAEIETLNQSITQQQAKETTNQNGQNT